MATNLTVDTADKSSRWYITPGTTSTYDLQVHNDTDRAVLCRITLASHPDTGSVKPQSLTLQARETRIVAVTFGPEAKLPRDRKALILVKDAAGQVMKTIERELISGASTDATIELLWKAPIVEDGKLCGFVLLCNIRSLSGCADEFTPDFAPHAALRFPELSPVWLEPGDTAHLELPIRWDRAARDTEGWNHPRAIEAFVAVSQGRRSGRLSWDVVQRTIGDMLDRSDRSPVVERKAASPSFKSGSVAPAAPANAAPPLAAVPDRPIAAPPIAVPPTAVQPSAKPARPLEVVKPVAPAAADAKATSTALVKVVPALGPARPAQSPPAAVAPTASAVPAVASAISATITPAAARAAASVLPDAPIAPAAGAVPAAAAVATTVATATAGLAETVAQRRPAAQPQPQPKPVTPDAVKPQAPETPKKLRDVAAEHALNSDGYRPAFQLVNNQTAAQANASSGSTGTALDGTIRVDDLDASIVGSGLNYSRSSINGHVGVQSRRSLPAGAWVAGIAVAAVLGFVLFRPHPHTVPPTTANAAAAPVTAPAQGHAVTAQAHAARPNHVAAHVAPKPKVALPSPAAVAQTPLATAPPAVHAVVAAPAVATVAHTATRAVVRRPPPIDRGALPQIDYVDASYGRYGRAVSVQWSSTAQASADVQLTDARGTLIGERAVNGGRSRVVVGLPRGFHGGVYIQVSVTGYHSERVVQTSSLSPF